MKIPPWLQTAAKNKEVIAEKPEWFTADTSPNYHTKYDKRFPDMIYAYFDIDKYTQDTGQVVHRGRVYTGAREAINLPTIVQFCKIIGITDTTFRNWEKETLENGELKYPEFAKAAAFGKAVQEDILTINGLKGLYPFGMVKLLLNIHHNRVERSSNDLNVSGAIGINIDSSDKDL